MQKFAEIRAHTMRLPEMKKRMQALEARLAELEAALGKHSGGSA
jgi:hypothetical protein